jgi:hypothetical protein
MYYTSFKLVVKQVLRMPKLADYMFKNPNIPVRQAETVVFFSAMIVLLYEHNGFSLYHISVYYRLLKHLIPCIALLCCVLNKV